MQSADGLLVCGSVLAGLVFPDPSQPMAVPLKHFHIETNIFNGIATTKISQEYQNYGKNPIETTYFLPVDPDMVVSSLEITIGDRYIKAKIEDMQRAHEKYEDAVAGGKGAVLGKYVEEKQDALSLQVGNLLPG